MTQRAISVLVLAGFLAAGCTAIVYGDLEQSSRDEAEASGGDAGLGGTTPRPSPAEPGAGDGGAASGASSRGGAGAAGEGGSSESSAGMPSSGGALAGGAAGEPSRAGGAGGEPSSSEGGAGEGGDAGAAGSPAAGQAGSGGDAGSAGAPPLLPGDPARGYKLVVLNNCYRCHGSDLAGQGFYRNITPDEATGIGSWSDAEIARGIAGGTNQAGELLCASMPIYSGISRQGMLDLIAFLRGIPARHNPITTVCPGHDP